ncbi:MFS transporter [Hyphomicrobium sp. MC1]|uniref:MFS transporter n=1 Tax=Hyphomicrobium sp. (strain MC1) TaxID=717785 RepID=UPI000213EFD3|nr:MFS transporter [Hyphomicrobium sp. MC1]CCB66672.1 Proline/glycine betaine transporter: Permease of the major facilitator superfamily (MFS); MFS transporter, MHS family [Hyphomicrobium sp. MC1]
MAIETDFTTIAKQTHVTRRAIVAATVGNTMEWYDFAVFGYFSAVIGKLFFSSSNDTASLLLTLATFGVGFVMRPVGSLVLGSIADRRGRKAALTFSIVLMAAGTGLIGCAPTYTAVGLAAPLVIVIARLLQGFACGGEIGGATAFLAEHAPPEMRGFYASWQQASQACALLMGSLFGAMLSAMLTPAELESWGWRIPFLFGLLIAPIGVYIRNSIEESPAYLHKGTLAATPIRDTFRFHRRSLLVGMGITVTWTVCTYFFLVYMPTYATRELHIDRTSSLIANSVGLLVVLMLVPVFGLLSDWTGRRPLMLGAALCISIGAYPALYALTLYPNFTALIATHAIFGLLIAAFTGPAPAKLTELFPVEVRSTGLSISYNLAVTIFGGFAPFIAAWLIEATESKLAPASYVMSASLIGILALLVPKRSDRAIG